MATSFRQSDTDASVMVSMWVFQEGETYKGIVFCKSMTTLTNADVRVQPASIPADSLAFRILVFKLLLSYDNVTLCNN